MTRARLALLLPLLVTTAACETQRKPLTGFDEKPPGILVGQPGGNTVIMWPIFDLPLGAHQTYLPRLNGEDTVIATSDEGFYDYAKIYLQGWTGGWSHWIMGIPTGTYTVELVDSAGESWGKSPPLELSLGDSYLNPTGQMPVVIFTNFDGQVGSWTIDPRTQDADPATDEITVTNLLDEDVIVDRCMIVKNSRTDCTTVGKVGPGADLLTVETVVDVSVGDYPALFVRSESDATLSFERDLVRKNVHLSDNCQIERILVHGTRPTNAGATSFAMSSCYGYGSREPSFQF